MENSTFHTQKKIVSNCVEKCRQIRTTGTTDLVTLFNAFYVRGIHKLRWQNFEDFRSPFPFGDKFTTTKAYVVSLIFGLPFLPAKGNFLKEKS